MTAPKLDRSKPFGTIHGSFHGAIAEQGSHYFGASDVYLFSMNAKGGRYDAEQAVEPAGAQAPAGQTDPAPQANSTTRPEIDLAKWARGEQSYLWPHVKKAAADAYPDMNTTNKQAILSGLVSRGVITAAEAGLEA